VGPGRLVLLGIAGVASGFVNTIAGGAAVFTVPLLILFGLPAGAANATNRVSVLAQSISGGLAFGRAGKLDRSVLAWVCLPAVVGAVLGSWAVTLVPDDVLRPILLVTMVAVGAAALFLPGRPQGHDTEGPRDVRTVTAVAAMFASGVYAGFLQAGVGLVLLMILAGGLRYDLVRANALKVVVVAGAVTAALGVFVASGLVVWGPGLALAAGSVVGAQIGARTVIRRGDRLVRVFVLVMAVVVVAAVILGT